MHYWEIDTGAPPLFAEQQGKDWRQNHAGRQHAITKHTTKVVARCSIVTRVCTCASVRVGVACCRHHPSKRVPWPRAHSQNPAVAVQAALVYWEVLDPCGSAPPTHAPCLLRQLRNPGHRNQKQRDHAPPHTRRHHDLVVERCHVALNTCQLSANCSQTGHAHAGEDPRPHSASPCLSLHRPVRSLSRRDSKPAKPLAAPPRFGNALSQSLSHR